MYICNMLTEKEKIFCREYIYDWNATRAYKKAFSNWSTDSSASSMGCKLLKDVEVKEYIDKCKADLERMAGISRRMVLGEHMKLAFSSIANLHNTWVDRKRFEKLTEDEKSCIQEIQTQTKKVYDDIMDEVIEVEFVKIKLYDKQKALDSINKMMGYNEPEKVDVTTKGEKINDFTQYSDDELRTLKEIALRHRENND